MIGAIIVDDESHSRNFLRGLLAEHCSNIQVLDEASCAEEAFVKIQSSQPKIVFLDIRMRAKSGFSLLKMFDDIKFEVIFVSAYDKYAIRAFEFNAIAYILKPIDIDKLKKATEKATDRIISNTRNDLALHFIQNLSEGKDVINKFSVHHNGKVIFVHISEISFIEAKQGNTMIVLTDKSRFFSSKNLAQFETLLSETHNFIRINKSIILNTKDLRSYSKGEICTIHTRSGHAFEVSRRRKSDILKSLKEL